MAFEFRKAAGLRALRNTGTDTYFQVASLEKLGADERKERWVIMRAPTGQRFCVVRVQRDGFACRGLRPTSSAERRLAC